MSQHCAAQPHVQILFYYYKTTRSDESPYVGKILHTAKFIQTIWHVLFLSQQSSVLLSYLEGVTVVALCALATPEKSAHTPSALLETAAILHGL